MRPLAVQFVMPFWGTFPSGPTGPDTGNYFFFIYSVNIRLLLLLLAVGLLLQNIKFILTKDPLELFAHLRWIWSQIGTWLSSPERTGGWLAWCRKCSNLTLQTTVCLTTSADMRLIKPTRILFFLTCILILEAADHKMPYEPIIKKYVLKMDISLKANLPIKIPM